ncbi:MAG: TetR/AcrR family transcriptional regulator [Pseudomonadota bacterium]
MPRPSLKKERRAEILEAFGRCIARYGVEGATLERIAEQAGLARSLIRHNIGNKDELLDAFLDDFLDRADAESNELFENLPSEGRVATMIDWLFSSQPADSKVVSVTNALISAAIDRPVLARRLRDWTASFTDRIGRELDAAFPDSPADDIEAVASGVAAIYFNFDTMVPLGGVTRLRESSRAAAVRLVETLAGQD